MKLTYIMDTSSTELRLLFHKVSLIINIRFHCLWDALCCLHKTLLLMIGGHHACCVSTHRVLKYSLLIVHHSGGQNDGSHRVRIKDCGEDEGEHSAPLLQFPPLCVEWCMFWWFIFKCGQTLQIQCFNLCNICTFHSELIVAPLSKNLTNKIPSLSRKMVTMTLLAKVYTLSFLLNSTEWWCHSTDCLFVSGS